MAKTETWVPQAVICRTQAQMDVYLLSRYAGKGAIATINDMNRGPAPLCMLWFQRFPHWELPDRSVLIGTHVYQIRYLTVLVGSFLDPRYEPRVILSLAPAYRI